MSSTIKKKVRGRIQSWLASVQGLTTVQMVQTFENTALQTLHIRIMTPTATPDFHGVRTNGNWTVQAAVVVMGHMDQITEAAFDATCGAVEAAFQDQSGTSLAAVLNGSGLLCMTARPGDVSEGVDSRGMRTAAYDVQLYCGLSS